jgi:serine/threonine protein kinase
VVLHECLTGTTPFSAETRVTFIAHKLDATPSSVRAVPAMVNPTSALESLLARMMAPTPESRPQSAADLFQEFAQID